MPKGLHIWKNHGKQVVLDAENAFWAHLPEDSSGIFMPKEVLSAYARFKDKFDADMKDFRFSAELTAVYIDPTDKCNANCAYCYVPQEARKNGRSMSKQELEFILDKLAAYFKNKKKSDV